MPSGLMDIRHHGEKAFVDEDADPETVAAAWHRGGNLLADVNIVDELHGTVFKNRTADDQRRVARHIRRHGEAAERLITRTIPRKGGAERILRGSPLDISPDCERIAFASERTVCSGENVPHGEIQWAFLKGTLPAECGVLRIAAREEVECGKDIRTLTCGGSLPIGGKYGEKVVVEGVPLRTRQQIAEKFVSTYVVAPEYAEIVRHVTVLSFAQSVPSLVHRYDFSPNHCGRAARIAGQCSPLLAIARTKLRARG